MAVGAGTTQTFEAFRQAVAPYLAGNAGDVIKVQELLSKLKLDIARFDSTNPIATGCDSQELLLARETLELAAIFSVSLKDIGSFERHVIQLKRYYNDFPNLSPASQRRPAIYGLWLLFLLFMDRIGEFHTEYIFYNCQF